jgi:hypothetical protein
VQKRSGLFLEFYTVQIGSKIQEEIISQIEASQEGLCSKELIITLNLVLKFSVAYEVLLQ